MVNLISFLNNSLLGSKEMVLSNKNIFSIALCEICILSQFNFSMQAHVSIIALLHAK